MEDEEAPSIPQSPVVLLPPFPPTVIIPPRDSSNSSLAAIDKEVSPNPGDEPSSLLLLLPEHPEIEESEVPADLEEALLEEVPNEEIVNILTELRNNSAASISFIARPKFGQVVPENAKADNFMIGEEMVLFFEYLEKRTSLQYGSKTSKAYIFWTNLFRSKMNSILLQNFFRKIYELFFVSFVEMRFDDIADCSDDTGDVNDEGNEHPDETNGIELGTETQAKKDESEIITFYLKPCVIVRKKLATMQSRWMNGSNGDGNGNERALHTQFVDDVLSICYASMEEPELSFTEILTNFKENIIWKFIHTYIYRKCFEYFTKPTTDSIAELISQEMECGLLDILKIESLLDYYVNQIRAFVIRKKGNKELTEYGFAWLLANLVPITTAEAAADPNRKLLNSNQEVYGKKKSAQVDEKARIARTGGDNTKLPTVKLNIQTVKETFRNALLRMLHITNVHFSFTRHLLRETETIRNAQQKVISFMENDQNLLEKLQLCNDGVCTNFVETKREECKALISNYFIYRVVGSSNQSAVLRDANYASVRGKGGNSIRGSNAASTKK